MLPKEVIDLLTESQSQIHLAEPWFHRGLSRDVAQKILATHNVDGYVTLPALKSLCCGSRGCRKFRHTYLLILNSAILFEDKTDIESVNIKLPVFFLQFYYAKSILPITQSGLYSLIRCTDMHFISKAGFM